MTHADLFFEKAVKLPDDLKKVDRGAWEKGFANLERHVGNLWRYDVPVIVSINRFSTDTEGEVALLRRLCAALSVECVLADHWAQGAAGAADLARAVVRTIATKPSDFHPLYPDDMSLWRRRA